MKGVEKSEEVKEDPSEMRDEKTTTGEKGQGKRGSLSVTTRGLEDDPCLLPDREREGKVQRVHCAAVINNL